MSTGTPRTFNNVIAKGNHANNTFTSNVVTVPTNMVLNGVRFTIDSTNGGAPTWSDPAVTMHLFTEFSLDGGATWRPDFDQDISGGHTNHQGVPTDPDPESSFSPPLPTGAQYRGRLVVTTNIFFGLSITFFTTP